MTRGQTLGCARCGFENAPGDQFCGSCGAFLEWEAAPAVDAAPVAGGAPTGEAAAQRAPAPPGASDAGAPPPSATPPSPGTSTAGGELLRCPACGIANPADRTFCQTCGARLSGADAVAARSREEVAAAVAAVVNPPSAAVPVRSRSGSSAPAKRRGGMPVWIVVVLVLGGLVGVAAVVGPSLLQGGGPSSIASSAPLPSGGTPSAAVSASPPAGTSMASASAAPAAGPLKLTGASASSVLLGDVSSYGPQNAIDGSPKTSWQEGAAQAKGQWIEVSFEPATVTGVVIRNGFQASTALFKGNLRLKDVLVSVDGGTPLSARLKDATAPLQITLAPVAGATRLRITIVTTYPSVKTAVGGTPFQDAAVSEISVLGIPAP